MLKDAYFQIKLLVSDMMDRFSKKEEPPKQRAITAIPLISSPSDPADSIPIIPVTSVQAINQFFHSNKNVMHRFFIKKLQKAIHENKKVIELFRLGDTSIVAKLVEENYEPLIEDALQYFIENEDYEMAKRCQELKDTYHVNKLLQSTQTK